MCPACLASLSMIVAGVVSSGSVTALAARTLLRKEEFAAEGPAVRNSDEFPSLEKKEKKL
jgi:hypothetical protein